MMADSENRRRERAEAIRSADELLFSTLSALFPERSAAISTFDITRQRVADGTHWIGGMEHRPDVHGIRTGEGWKVDLEIGHRNNWTPEDPAAFHMLGSVGASILDRSKSWPITVNRA